MASRETGVSGNASLPFLESIRQQVAQIPAGSHTEDGLLRTGIDFFSAARIFVTFKVKLAEHFPEAMPDETFDFLVDLMVHEWLSRRIGAQRPAELGLSRSASLSPRIQHALALGLIALEMDPAADDLRIVTLTRSARARLNVFFDYMASYISAL
ncbi:hypothetical protein [Sphingobium sp. SYK-6]|uniref:hypothetical protein n=1 Tax=Sphingobium sp. (strain NBRC 103272 / SYK-6) TaxID=627192 RepID=UPI00059D08DB|nr:hypothetical protein [Sphingobium sp. SYK-6]